MWFSSFPSGWCLGKMWEQCWNSSCEGEWVVQEGDCGTETSPRTWFVCAAVNGILWQISMHLSAFVVKWTAFASGLNGDQQWRNNSLGLSVLLTSVDISSMLRGEAAGTTTALFATENNVDVYGDGLWHSNWLPRDGDPLASLRSHSEFLNVSSTRSKSETG